MSVDVEQGLTRFLEAQWDEPVAVATAHRSTVGARRLNLVFDATRAGGQPTRLVATIVPEGELSPNPVAGEVAVRQHAVAGGVRTPRVVAHSEDPGWVGGPFFVSEFVDGETVPRRVLRLADDSGNGRAVAEAIGASLARLHALDDLPAEVPVRRPQGDPVAHALHELVRILDELPLRRPVLELGLRWLHEHRPAPPTRCAVVHGDVRTGNVIVGRDGLRAILDWESATAASDPMLDLAWPLLRMWRFGNDDREVGGLADRTALVEGYEAAGGVVDHERLDWWKVESTARWATGLLEQSVAYLEGRVPSIVQAASGRRVVEMEWDLLALIR